MLVYWPNLMYYLGTCLKLLTVSTHNLARPAGLTEIVVLDIQNKETECICIDRDVGCKVLSPSRATWSAGHYKARCAFIFNVT